MAMLWWRCKSSCIYIATSVHHNRFITYCVVLALRPWWVERFVGCLFCSSGIVREKKLVDALNEYIFEYFVMIQLKQFWLLLIVGLKNGENTTRTWMDGICWNYRKDLMLTQWQDYSQNTNKKESPRHSPHNKFIIGMNKFW